MVSRTSFMDRVRHLCFSFLKALTTTMESRVFETSNFKAADNLNHTYQNARPFEIQTLELSTRHYSDVSNCPISPTKFCFFRRFENSGFQCHAVCVSFSLCALHAQILIKKIYHSVGPASLSFNFSLSLRQSKLE